MLVKFCAYVYLSKCFIISALLSKCSISEGAIAIILPILCGLIANLWNRQGKYFYYHYHFTVEETEI